jgi:hypothetical protein
VLGLGFSSGHKHNSRHTNDQAFHWAHSTCCKVRNRQPQDMGWSPKLILRRRRRAGFNFHVCFQPHRASTAPNVNSKFEIDLKLRSGHGQESIHWTQWWNGGIGSGGTAGPGSGVGRDRESATAPGDGVPRHLQRTGGTRLAQRADRQRDQRVHGRLHGWKPVAGVGPGRRGCLHVEGRHGADVRLYGWVHRPAGDGVPDLSRP